MPKSGSNVQKFPAGESLIAMSQYHLAGAPSKEGQNGGETVDLGSVLIELVEHCRQQMAPDLTISLSAKLGAGSSIPTREAITLEFVICEIVTNAYRYSNPLGTSVEVTIECRVNRNGEIVIDIGDDGVGLPPDFGEWCDAGNGMVSVRRELQKIGAVLNITTDDFGLQFQIILHPCRPRKTPACGNFVWL